MVMKKDKSRQCGVSHAEYETSGCTALVGTYKGKQLERWPGYYNYPIGEDDDSSRVEYVDRVDGRVRLAGCTVIPRAVFPRQRTVVLPGLLAPTRRRYFR